METSFSTSFEVKMDYMDYRGWRRLMAVLDPGGLSVRRRVRIVCPPLELRGRRLRRASR